MLAALGVVFGDIGTSPLYTLRECFLATGMSVTPGNIMGVLSAIAWSLILVVTIKYVAVVMRADNRGEGGILALTALATDQFANPKQRRRIILIGLLGASLFYGDAVITPAISVLSAVEGLNVATPHLSHFVIPLSMVLIVMLFAAQRFGTAAVARLFGPIMLVWFCVLALLGLYHIGMNPQVMAALSPHYFVMFMLHHPMLSFLTLSAVVLAVTGVESLYADMGHFGRQPIQKAWLILVGPALLFNYFGQGALLLANHEALANPFYHMVPQQFLIPMLVLATMATIIASQAVISGTFSLTQQAIQLGYLPRFDIRHTNADMAGQIYIPALNGMLLAGVVLLVLSFRSSSNLAAAYGLAVTGTMLFTTLMSTTVLVNRNRWKWWAAALFFFTFIIIDSTFLTANLHKIPEGGWFPLLLGAALFFIMHTWTHGREATQQLVLRQTPPIEEFLAQIDPTLPHVNRTAIFLTSDVSHAPPALVYNINHNGILHAQIIIMKIARARIPRYPNSERITVHHYPHNITTVQATYGFMERPNVPKLLAELPHHGLTIRHPEALSYFLSAHTYVPSNNAALNRWQEPVFTILDSLTQPAVTYFHLPRQQVIEIGNHIEI